ncbi:hypothetical protein KDX14_27700 [Burkholderia cenocepacia]|uniref:hypothetical protein n=1 Tax=Burkholderia cepacia complex TaxID=87882 RepID=UPI000F58FE56|nr:MULTISPECIES: hypothetical protein [Burkholderia cepacia complex]MBR8073315.1 hypothetical protein [Burkholderia cenocepacia]RQS79764.1 hypothetical protein DF032_14425 [Burkholderia seminalis]
MSPTVSGKPGSFASLMAARTGIRPRCAHFVPLWWDSPMLLASAEALPAHSIATSNARASSAAQNSSAALRKSPLAMAHLAYRMALRVDLVGQRKQGALDERLDSQSQRTRFALKPGVEGGGNSSFHFALLIEYVKNCV